MGTGCARRAFGPADLEVLRVPELTIDAVPKQHVAVDGEVITETPIQVSVARKALFLMAPGDLKNLKIIIDDPVTERAREGARRLLAHVLIAGADAFVAMWKDLKLRMGVAGWCATGMGGSGAIQISAGRAPRRQQPCGRG